MEKISAHVPPARPFRSVAINPKERCRHNDTTRHDDRRSTIEWPTAKHISKRAAIEYMHSMLCNKSNRVRMRTPYGTMVGATDNYFTIASTHKLVRCSCTQLDNLIPRDPTWRNVHKSRQHSVRLACDRFATLDELSSITTIRKKANSLNDGIDHHIRLENSAFREGLSAVAEFSVTINTQPHVHTILIVVCMFERIIRMLLVGENAHASNELDRICLVDINIRKQAAYASCHVSRKSLRSTRFSCNHRGCMCQTLRQRNIVSKINQYHVLHSNTLTP